jgi:hypothetical protein
MIATFRDEVTRARAAEHANLDEGWILHHETVERSRLLEDRVAAHREVIRLKRIHNF